MDVWIVFLILGILLLLGLALGVALLIVFLVKQFGQGAGGWKRLSQVCPAATLPNLETMKRRTVQIGLVLYQRCVTVGIAPDGLYPAIGRRAALLPWAEFPDNGQGKLHWQNVPVLSIGDPAWRRSRCKGRCLR